MEKKRHAIVWGAAGGIGRAVVQKLAADGWRVLAISRDESTIPDEASLVLGIRDIADEFSLQQAMIEAGYEVEVAGVDLFIYAVGDIVSAPVRTMSADDWTRILDANLTGAYLATRLSLPLLAEDAHLVFVGAVNERLRLPGLSAYASAKAGLEAFADALRKEERQKRVTVLRPGAVDTPLWGKVPMNLPKDAMSAETLAGKLMEAVDDGHKGVLDLVH